MLDLTLSGQAFSPTLVPITSPPLHRTSTTRTRPPPRKPRTSGKLITRKKLSPTKKSEGKTISVSQSTPNLREGNGLKRESLPHIAPVQASAKVEKTKTLTKQKTKVSTSLRPALLPYNLLQPKLLTSNKIQTPSGCTSPSPKTRPCSLG